MGGRFLWGKDWNFYPTWVQIASRLVGAGGHQKRLCTRVHTIIHIGFSLIALKGILQGQSSTGHPRQAARAMGNCGSIAKSTWLRTILYFVVPKKGSFRPILDHKHVNRSLGVPWFH